MGPAATPNVSSAHSNGEPPRVGLVAGWGRYPLVVAEALKRQGRYVSCLAIKGHADPALAGICDDITWLGLGRLGKALRHFRRQGIHEATMAGKVHKTVLYQPWVWLKHMPDWTFVRTFYPQFVARRRDRRDDTLLGAVVDAFAAENIHFGPATRYAPELLVDAGHLAGPPPTRAEQSDIELGWQLAKEMGRLDVGQSVCVKNGAVLAVEAIEGTDAAIGRAGGLCKAGGFTVVKVAKPQQDMRFDVPTVGVGTLQTMLAAGASVLAIEAGRTIVLDQPQFAQLARKNRLTVVALERGAAASLEGQTPRVA